MVDGAACGVATECTQSVPGSCAQDIPLLREEGPGLEDVVAEYRVSQDTERDKSPSSALQRKESKPAAPSKPRTSKPRCHRVRSMLSVAGRCSASIPNSAARESRSASSTFAHSIAHKSGAMFARHADTVSSPGGSFYAV